MNTLPDKDQLIRSLNLQPHPKEGGYYRRTYQSGQVMSAFGGERHLMTSIFYLLTTDHPIGFLHRNRSDIIHYFHLGGPTEYLMISPQGEISHAVIGPDVLAGHQLQLLVPGGYWKASRLLGGPYSLISEAVSPGFDYADNQLACRDDISALNVARQEEILPWLKPEDA
ncbi:MAG: cupin domain-containing protein [Ketobacteraceae bacterium]|nr:cupin domain-containing protein [Ketobacteraceae bacterium]